jgi:hypothetical protein
VTVCNSVCNGSLIQRRNIDHSRFHRVRKQINDMLLFFRLEYVPVSLVGNADIGVSKVFTDYFNWYSRTQGKSGISVAKVMRCQVWQWFAVFDKCLNTLANICLEDPVTSSNTAFIQCVVKLLA